MQKCLVYGKWSAYSNGSKQPLSHPIKIMITLNSTILKGTIGSEAYAALTEAWPTIVAMKLAVPAGKRHDWKTLDKYQAQIAAMHPSLAGTGEYCVAATVLCSQAFRDIA